MKIDFNEREYKIKIDMYNNLVRDIEHVGLGNFYYCFTFI
jgi:hypothetical protein